MTTPLENVLHALYQTTGDQPKQSGTGWTSRCPAHDDTSPSLSIAEGDDCKALVNCFAGCTTEEIVAALGLAMRDLMPCRGDNRPRLVHRRQQTESHKRSPRRRPPWLPSSPVTESTRPDGLTATRLANRLAS